jgi:hypothetical protein
MSEDAMKHLFMFLTITLFCSAASAESSMPTRTVRATTLTSERDPAVVVELPKQARYVGADRWVLYDVADCELHIFVEADEQKNVKRFYWIQFEGYIPSRPELKYRIPTTPPVNIGGFDFYTRARFGPTTEPPKAGTESERVMRLFNANGYKLPPHMMNARFIHYLDKEMRKELMIIVSEDLTPTGYTSQQLIDGNGPKPEWTPIGEALIQRAKASVVVKPQIR